MTMWATSRILGLLVLVLLLPSCAAISTLTQSSRPLEIYELRTPDLPPVGSAGRDVEVVIEQPATGGALDTDRIMIRPGPLQAQYLPGARWADPAPAMLQTLILRSILESGAVGSAGRRSVGGSPDYAVLSELTDFQAEIAPDSDATTIRLGLIVRLVREGDAEVVALRTFSITQPAAGSRTGPIIAAFDLASRRLLVEAVPWILGAIRRAGPPGGA